MHMPGKELGRYEDPHKQYVILYTKPTQSGHPGKPEWPVTVLWVGGPVGPPVCLTAGGDDARCR